MGWKRTALARPQQAAFASQRQHRKGRRWRPKGANLCQRFELEPVLLALGATPRRCGSVFGVRRRRSEPDQRRRTDNVADPIPGGFVDRSNGGGVSVGGVESIKVKKKKRQSRSPTNS